MTWNSRGAGEGWTRVRWPAGVLVVAVLAACTQAPVGAVPTRVATLPPPATHTAIAAPLPTTTPDATAAALAQQATVTAAVAALPTLSPASQVETSESPAGNGRVVLWRAPCVALPGVAERLGYDELRWEATDGGRRLIVRQVIACDGLAAGGLRLVQFAPDGQSLYYTDGGEGTSDGLGCGWAGTLWRWSIATGERRPLLSGATAPDGVHVAGAAGSRLMVWRWTDGQVLLELAPVPEGWQITATGWSPLGDRLVVIANDSGCVFGGESVVLVIDPEDGATRAALRSRDPFFMTSRFETPDEVTVFGIDNQPTRFVLGADDQLRALP